MPVTMNFSPKIKLIAPANPPKPFVMVHLLVRPRVMGKPAPQQLRDLMLQVVPGSKTTMVEGGHWRNVFGKTIKKGHVVGWAPLKTPINMAFVWWAYADFIEAVKGQKIPNMQDTIDGYWSGTMIYSHLANLWKDWLTMTEMEAAWPHQAQFKPPVKVSLQG